MALLIDSVSRNFGLKVTAVLVAVILWFTFNYFSVTHVGYSKTLDVAVSVHGVSAGLVVASPVASPRVSVELSGSRPDIDSVTPPDLPAYVDVSGKPAGVYTLPVNVVGENADKVKAVTPSQLVVILDRYAYRTVPVVVRDAGGGPLSNATVTPGSVQVAGPESAVAQVYAAEVSVPEPRALPRGFAAEIKPTPVDSKLQPLSGVAVLGVVRIVGPALEPVK